MSVAAQEVTVPARPKIGLTASELPRAGIETARLLLQLKRLINNAKTGQGQPILTLPGYGGDDHSMLALRFFLKRIGYRPYGLELGRNFETPEERIRNMDDACAFRDRMVNEICQRVDQLYEQTQQPIILIGWSMGGCYALDVSQQRQHKVAKVITLGSPFGDPRGTATWPVLRFINRGTVPPEQQNFEPWLNRRQLQSSHIPVHIIYSQRDGIVHQDVARLPAHSSVNHIEVDSSHIAFSWNANAFEAVAQVLAD
jgi:pimeloyl-ACP methyl ester carboxylesterase